MALQVINNSLYRRIGSDEFLQILGQVNPATLVQNIDVQYPNGTIRIPAGAKVYFESDVIQGGQLDMQLPPTQYPLLRVEQDIISDPVGDDIIYTYSWLSGPGTPVEYIEALQQQSLIPIPEDRYVILVDDMSDTICVGIPKDGLMVLSSDFMDIGTNYPVLDGNVLRIIPGSDPRSYLKANTQPYSINIYEQYGDYHVIPAEYSYLERQIWVRGIVCFEGMASEPMSLGDIYRIAEPYTVPAPSIIFGRTTKLFPSDTDIIISS